MAGTRTKPAAAFAKGDRVAWSHMVAVQHAPGSIVYASTMTALAPDVKFGTVKAVANDEGTWFDVLIDDAKEPITLTADELVKVNDDE